MRSRHPLPRRPHNQPERRDWPEPFGLMVIEAMACGTPAIAFNRGSVPEIIDGGVTGRIVENETEAVGAVTSAVGLSRERIRWVFEQRHTVRRMAEECVDVYEQLAGQQRPRLRVVVSFQ